MALLAIEQLECIERHAENKGTPLQFDPEPDDEAPPRPSGFVIQVKHDRRVFSQMDAARAADHCEAFGPMKVGDLEIRVFRDGEHE